MTGVRIAAVDDADGLGRVHVEAWRAGYSSFVPTSYLEGLDAADSSRSWREWLAAQRLDGPCTLVACDGADVVGFSTVGPLRDNEGADPPDVPTSEVWTLYVEPSSWGTDVGARLHDAALVHLRRHRSEAEAALWVFRDNGRARRFYERRGWRPDGATNTFELDGVALTELRYRRSLGTS